MFRLYYMLHRGYMYVTSIRYQKIHCYHIDSHTYIYEWYITDM